MLRPPEPPEVGNMHRGHSSRTQLFPHRTQQQQADDTQDVDAAAVMQKVDRHLVPWFFTLGIMCYLDRTNLSFAALQLNRDLNLSCATYGLGAGIFFAGYALFQVPSNMALVRLGAPVWLGFIVVAWGVVATLFAFTTGTAMFLTLRLALGVAECGAFPGIWYHLSRFYSENELGPAYAKVATCTALAQVIGAPLAAAILTLDGAAGLKGWQWLFILEGVPTIAFGVALRLVLAPSPAKAKFLSPEERVWLQRRQDEAASSAGSLGGGQCLAVLRVMRNWRIVYLGLNLLMIGATMYGIIFWCPLLINNMFNQQGDGGRHHDPCGSGSKSEGDGGDSSADQPQQLHNAVIALLSAVPFAVAAGGMVLNAKLAQRANERHKHAGIPTMLAALFLGLVPLLTTHVGVPPAFISLVLAAGCTWAFHGPFMSWPAVFLKGPEAAAGFAFMNSLGAVGGFAGPYMIGLLAGGEGGYGRAMLVLAVFLLISGALILVFPVGGRPEPTVIPVSTEALEDDVCRLLKAAEGEEVRGSSGELEMHKGGGSSWDQLPPPALEEQQPLRR